MDSQNSKTSKPHVLIHTDKIDLRRGETNTSSSNLSVYYTWKNKNKSYNSNKIKISGLTWNDKFELPDGLCSISGLSNYLKYIF